MFSDTTPFVPINGTDPDVNPEIVRFVVVAYVLFSLVIVPLATVRLVVEAVIADRLEIVVVASVELPLTVRVPCESNDDVAIISPPVIDENIAVIPEIKLAKKLVDVALSKNALRAKRLVVVLLVEEAFSAIRVLLTVVLSVVKLEIVPVDEVS